VALPQGTNQDGSSRQLRAVCSVPKLCHACEKDAYADVGGGGLAVMSWAVYDFITFTRQSQGQAKWHVIHHNPANGLALKNLNTDYWLGKLG
jgi:hypothetical protein